MKKKIYLFLLIGIHASFAQKPSKIDSLKKVIATTKIDTAKVWTLIALGNEIEGPKPQEAYKYYKEAEAISRKANYTLGIIKAISNFTYILDLQEKFNESKPYYEEAVALAKNGKFGAIQVAKTNLNLGTWYYRTGDYVKTLEYYTTGVKAAENTKDQNLVIITKANMASIYQGLKRYQETIKICDELIPVIKTNPEHVFSYIQILNAKGMALQNLEKYKASQPVYELALKAAEKADNKELMCSVLTNLSVTYHRTNQIEKSFEASKRCIAVSREIGDMEGERNAYHNMGNIYFYKDQQDSAKKYYDLAYKLSIDRNIKEEIHEVYSSLGSWYLRNGNMKKYVFFAEKADSMEVALEGEQVQSTAKEIEVKYDLEKKQNEILQKDIDLQKSRSNNQLMGFGIAGMALLAGFGFYSYRKKQETKLLASALESQKTERSRIASEMHDDLGGNLTSLMYAAHLLKTQHPEDKNIIKVEAMSTEISETINEIIWSLNAKQNTLSDWVLYVRGRMGELLESSGLSYGFEVSASLPNLNLTDTQKRNLYLVVKEAVNNAIKHANASQIDLSIKYDSGLQINIKDNGQGFVASTKTKTGSGNGLSNMKNRMESIGGQIAWIKTQGTAVALSLPLT